MNYARWIQLPGQAQSPSADSVLEENQTFLVVSETHNRDTSALEFLVSKGRHALEERWRYRDAILGCAVSECDILENWTIANA